MARDSGAADRRLDGEPSGLLALPLAAFVQGLPIDRHADCMLQGQGAEPEAPGVQLRAEVRGRTPLYESAGAQGSELWETPPTVLVHSPPRPRKLERLRD